MAVQLKKVQCFIGRERLKVSPVLHDHQCFATPGSPSEHIKAVSLSCLWPDSSLIYTTGTPSHTQPFQETPNTHHGMAVLMNIEKFAQNTCYKITGGLVYLKINQNKPCINIYRVRAGPKVQTTAWHQTLLMVKPIKLDLGFQLFRHRTGHNVVT